MIAVRRHEVQSDFTFRRAAAIFPTPSAIEANKSKRKSLAITPCDRLELSPQSNIGKRKITGVRMTATLLVDPDRTVAFPRVRVRPVPRSEPPTDDERGVLSTLLRPLELPTALVRRNPDEPEDDQSPVPAEPISAPIAEGASPRLRALASQVSIDEPPPVETAEAIAMRLATRRLLATCVEVLGGFRPVAQLRPFCLPERFDAIVNRLLGKPGSVPGNRGQAATRTSVVAGAAGPGRAAPPGGTDRVAVRRVQVCDVSGGVAEIAVVLARREKIWAMALRLELIEGRWLCTQLEVV
jgi:hypothetical protein